LTAINFDRDNPLPLLGAIVTGIGFLGAGALFRTGERVVGFTSAATVWIFAVFGLSVGVGEYLVSGLVYGAIWAVILIDQWLEKHWIGVHQRKLLVEVALETPDENLMAVGLPVRSSAQAIQIDREQGSLLLTYSINRPRGEAKDLLALLEGTDFVRRATVEPACFGRLQLFARRRPGLAAVLVTAPVVLAALAASLVPLALERAQAGALLGRELRTDFQHGREAVLVLAHVDLADHLRLPHHRLEIRLVLLEQRAHRVARRPTLFVDRFGLLARSVDDLLDLGERGRVDAKLVRVPLDPAAGAAPAVIAISSGR